MKNQFMTKTGSYLFMGLAVLSMLTSSCDKEDDEKNDGDDSAYKISFKVDEVKKEVGDKFQIPNSVFINVENQYSSIISAVHDDYTFNIQVFDIKPISEKEYMGSDFQETDNDNGNMGAIISYSDGETYYSSVSISNSDVHVKITKRTATAMRGTFKGTLQSGMINLI